MKTNIYIKTPFVLSRAKEDDPGQPCVVENSVWPWTMAPVSEYIYSANPRDHVLHRNWLNLDHIVYYIFGLKLDSNTWTPTSTWLWLVPKEIKPRDMQAPTKSCYKRNNQDCATTSVGHCTTNCCHGFPTPAGGGKGLVHDTGNHSKVTCMYNSEQGGRTRHQLGSFPCLDWTQRAEVIQGQASSKSPSASKENEVGEVNLNKAPPLPLEPVTWKPSTTKTRIDTRVSQESKLINPWWTPGRHWVNAWDVTVSLVVSLWRHLVTRVLVWTRRHEVRVMEVAWAT